MSPKKAVEAKLPAGVDLPFDLPCYIKVFRLMGKTAPRNDLPTVGELKGWTVELDYFTLGVKVHIKLERPDKMSVFLDNKKIGGHIGLRK